MSVETDQLRRMTGLTGDDSWSDTDLEDILTANGADLRLAAASVYEMLAAQYSKMVNVSESGSSRNLGDLYKNAMAMAAAYRTQPAAASVSAAKRTRIGQIERV